MPTLSQADQTALVGFATTLIDQHRARTIIAPHTNAEGFWFGGGNMIQAGDGTLLLVGRYRDAGDSRLGLASGRRGWKLSVLRADNIDAPFEEAVALTKEDLAVDGHDALSIEGAALRITTHGTFELFVSSEKSGIAYPQGLEDFLKPGAGVWTIDQLESPTLEGLVNAPTRTILQSGDPRFLHVKDPFLYDADGTNLKLLFCSHPYCWTSSNSGFSQIQAGDVVPGFTNFDFFPRGVTWDIAITRATCIIDVPPLGRFSRKHVSLVFYDGGEALRNLDEHTRAVQRPRGYSCEELGGVGYIVDGDFSRVHRLSVLRPLFVSPWGTGCSRYVDVLSTRQGLIATWQQSQQDHSQPLVMNFLHRQEIDRLLQ
jgi:hypothetical protein